MPSPSIGRRKPLSRNGNKSDAHTPPQLTWYSPKMVLPWLIIFAMLEAFRSITIHSRFSLESGDPTFEMPSSWAAAVWKSAHDCDDEDSSSSRQRHNNKKTAKVAYATTLTGYTPGNAESAALIDRAAVLHQSIKLAMSSSKHYSFDMVAFVHPDAIGCKEILIKLGYIVQVRDTPFDLKEIQNAELRIAQGNGCCQEKEYLKLYSYLLEEYPLVVHLDLDTIVLKPMDDVFDIMLETGDEASRQQQQRQQFARASSMWFQKDDSIDDMPRHIDFMFTRDYNMVEPPKKQVHQMGVQGGFLLVKPNRQAFQDMLQLIKNGANYTIEEGWGGKGIEYGGYYGAGTIQGLASYYYGHIGNFSRSVELNRCYYNNMADNPHFFNQNLNQTLCTTLEPDLSCQDCRITPIQEIYTAHFTVCGKPDWCGIVRPDERENAQLCMDLFREWHAARLSLEIEWMQRFPLYTPKLINVNSTESLDQRLWSYSHGHCKGGSYVHMKFPNAGNENADRTAVVKTVPS